MIDELQYLSRQELIEKWKELFNKNSPQHARKEFLIKHISWELQARKSGGFSEDTKKKFNKLSEKLAKGSLIESIKELSVPEIKSGTSLIREYKGERHQVMVLNKGFEYRNKIYKSLSAIANEITGSKWNGKVFFGVKK